jgi:hypothetical protein
MHAATLECATLLGFSAITRRVDATLAAAVAQRYQFEFKAKRLRAR